MKSLSSKGYGIVKLDIDPCILDNMRRELTVRPLQNGKIDENAPIITLYRESSKKIYVPKYYGLSKFGLPNRDDTQDCDTIDFKFNGTLRPEQMEPVDDFLKAAHDPLKRGGVINLSCGAGKTVIGLALVEKLGLKSMIIVHKDFLISQWRERITQFLPDARVGLVKAKVIDVEDKDIVIVSLQSLSMKTYDEDVFSKFGFVIIDEVHRTGTEVFSNALHKINFKYALGLSATIDRKDGMSKVFMWCIGDIVHSKKRDQDNVIVQSHIFYDKNPSYCTEVRIGFGPNSKLNLARMINNVCEFQSRDNVIVSHVNKLVLDDRKILVLSDRKSQLKNLESLLPNGMCGFYIGGMKPDALKKSELCSVILATYSFASEGFDAKGLDTLILASPKTDIEQSVGRILREKESDRTKIPIIVDIVDNFSIFERQAKKRAAFYKKNGFTIEIIKE